jgi:glycosyltransferase involved in cell wall biosynthesis
MLFMGQVEPHKGVVWLAEHLAELERLLARQVSLAVAGSGSALSLVQQHGGSRLSYLGMVPRESVATAMAAHDVVVVPSLCYENAPTVIVEARAVGTPVVASRIGGAPELVAKPSRCFGPGDVASLANCLAQLPQG